MNTNNFSGKVSFIWSVADLLRGPYRPNQYKDVMLPMTMLRRLDCVLEPTEDKVLARSSTSPSRTRQRLIMPVGYVFRKALEGLFIDRMDQNEEITAKFMTEDQFRDAVNKHLLKEVYEKIREEAEVENDI